MVISVYWRERSKLGSISVLASCSAEPFLRKARRKSGRTHLRPFPTPNAGRGRQTAMTPKPAGPPDGGWGWVVAAAAFAVNGLSYGLLRSLGLALPDLAEHFERSAQDTAWVSALALAVQQAASEGGPPRWEAGTGWRGRGCSDGRQQT